MSNGTVFSSLDMFKLIILQIINLSIVKASLLDTGLSALSSMSGATGGIDGVADKVGNVIHELSNKAGEGGGSLLNEMKSLLDGAGGNELGKLAEASINSAATKLVKKTANVVGSVEKKINDVLGQSSESGNPGAFYNFMYPDNDDYPWACVCDDFDYELFLQQKIDKVKCRNQLDTSLQNNISYCDPHNHFYTPQWKTHRNTIPGMDTVDNPATQLPSATQNSATATTPAAAATAA